MTAKSPIKNIAYFLQRQASALLLPKPISQPDSFSRILVYATIGIGDMIMFTPSLKAIRKRFPKAHIAILTGQSECEDVIRGGHLADEIIRFIPSHWKTLELACQLRRRHFDLLISPYLCRSLYLNNLIIFSGIPHRLGHCSSANWNCDNDYLFNIKVPAQSGLHESQLGRLLASALHCDNFDNQPVFFINKESEYFADQFFISHQLTGKWALAVQVGTVESQSWKQWDLPKLAQVCDRLMDNKDIEVILFGSAGHLSAVEELTRHMNRKPISVAGKTSLKQSAALIKKCQATLCNDTGLMHISSAVGTPVIAIVGPTDPKWTGPMGTGHLLIRKDLPCSPCYNSISMDTAAVLNCAHHDCLNLISVEDVLSAIGDFRDKSAFK